MCFVTVTTCRRLLQRVLLVLIPVLGWELLSASSVFASDSFALRTEDSFANPSLTRTWTLRAGPFGQDLNGQVAKKLRGRGSGASVTLDDLGLDTWTVSPLLSGRWRFADRWRLEIGYFNTDIDGKVGARDQFQFSGRSIPVGANLATSLKANAYAAELGYSFVKNDRAELGLRLGTYVFDLKATVNASAYISSLTATTGPATAQVVAPLPNVGLYGAYALSDRLTIQGSFGYLGATLGDWRGEALSASASLEYWIFDQFAIGAGYQFLDVDVVHKGSVFREEFDVTWQGPVVFGTLAF